MILGIDVGNTNTELAVFEGDEILQSWRFVTKTPRTSDEYGVLIKSFFENSGIKSGEISSVIMASVVPNIMYSLNNGIKKFIGIEPMVVGPGIRTGMPIHTADPTELGADRIVDAVAAFSIYGGPVIVIDFGTATTFDYVTAEGVFSAAVTTPGIQISVDALWKNAAKLPNIEIKKPASILAKDTVTSMQAGLVYGYIGQVEYIIEQMKKETGRRDMKVVATGGYGRLFYQETDAIDIYDPQLSLKGLKIIYDKNLR
ncbi:type III pantothenate kinase [Acetobacterium bakii]|uniref:Type III pantothenate kinase n=1 Tax=Acetobacterium bakii TaxID=52689 RepID=A0A0L6U5Z4_9FIRM|nr:type III pantothenate kinase [Acetobacterium bakii]KNZ43220.1 pantothenate kinase [Acetobacterium bakii]